MKNFPFVINLNYKNIKFDSNREKIDLEFLIQLPSKENFQRAKEYVSNLAYTPKKQSEEIVTENIWQVHKKYIISEINSGLVIIDQHVAHERILYEEALKAFESTSMASQTLLFLKLFHFHQTILMSC